MFRHLLECSLRDVQRHDCCLLVDLLARLRKDGVSIRCGTQPGSELGDAIENLLTRGYTLRYGFPRIPPDVQEEWLGRRLVLGHSRWFLGDASWTSIVSSRLGRLGRSLADWPALLEMLLRSIRRTGSLYLAVPGTAVAPLIEPLLSCDAVPYLQIRLPTPDLRDVAAWLTTRLLRPETEQTAAERWLYLSPEMSAASPGRERWPLQDRIAISCAQRVRALLVRPQGAIAHLLDDRLADSRFDTGTVSVWMPPADATETARPAALASNRARHLEWLDRGAVGWYIPPPKPRQAAWGCRQRLQAEPALWQLSSQAGLCCYGPAPPRAAPPRYLAHCVRGAPGALPPEAAANWIAGLWLSGCRPEDSPLATLAHILESGTLRGRSTLNRTDQPTVSFSGVPLDQLVQRRTFQPHLGRWDWEPFGLLIERQALEALGARPVIYGDDETYRQLSDSERPWFQVAARRRASCGRRDWKEECEWRIVGDVRLNALPRAAVHVFVAYQHQAQAFARHSAWPVIWLQDAQTLAPPSGSKRRSRKEVRTGRS